MTKNASQAVAPDRGFPEDPERDQPGEVVPMPKARLKSGQIRCEHCQKPYAKGYMSAHLRKAHDIWGGVSGNARGAYQKAAAKKAAAKKRAKAPVLPPGARPMPRLSEPAVVQPEVVPSPLSRPVTNRDGQAFTAVPYLVLEGEDGSLWIAERIR